MIDTLKEYFDALHRLKRNKPSRVPKGTQVSLDAIALEAGKKKGAIRRNRESFRPLVEAIDIAISEQLIEVGRIKPDEKLLSKVEKLSSDVLKFRLLYEESLARELSLVHQLFSEREEWARLNEALTGEKITTFNTRLRGQ